MERINPHPPTMGGVQQRAFGAIAHEEVEVLAAFPNSLAHAATQAIKEVNHSGLTAELRGDHLRPVRLVQRRVSRLEQ